MDGRIQMMMRWVIGFVALILPAVVAFAGIRLDHSAIGRDRIYAALALPTIVVSLILAAMVPAGLILTIRRSWGQRIAIVLAVWGAHAVAFTSGCPKVT
jgi:hypothetical protein